MKSLLLIVLIFAASACSTPNSVGVRPEFETSQVAVIAMAPTYSVGGFGMTARERAIVERAYQLRSIRWLENQGFEVIEPNELEASMNSPESRAALEEATTLEDSLTNYFEVTSPSFESIERSSLRELWKMGALPTPSILFTEVVYQSDGTCRVVATDYTELSEVVGPVEGARPCIISHFQATLVDARTGTTMWHNRMLREVRAELTPARRAENIDAVVRQTFAGPFGLAPFLRPARPSKDDSAAALKQ